MISDNYTTIKSSEMTLFKEKKSKFLGITFEVRSDQEVQDILNDLNKKYKDANHICYAYEIGLKENEIKIITNDNGEPNNTAGKPIYSQIKKHNLKNTLVAVIRYFGGVKLGTGGLISAYKKSAEITLNESVFKIETLEDNYEIIHNYSQESMISKLISKFNLKVINRDFGENCKTKISVKISLCNQLENEILNLKDLKLRKL